MPLTQASAIEIDRKLRDDFRRRVKDYGISAETTDPILAILFRTFAQQLEQLYSETDRIRLALLDELINNLGIQARMARPAQTVVRFSASRARVIPAGTELVGETRSGERLTFLTDATVATSEARIAFALVYQDGFLRLFPGVELPDALVGLRPTYEPVRVSLGVNPCLFLAFENLSAGHLGQHGLFFELGPDAYRFEQALQIEPWSLMNNAGELDSRGILRPKEGNAGLQTLQWLLPATTNSFGNGDNAPEQEVPALPTGFYGPRAFLLPPIPEDRRFTCQVPRGMDAALAKIFGKESRKVLDTERAWVRILLPGDVPPLHTSIGNIVLHATTCSNVESFNQTIVFEKQGTSIPIVREEGGAVSHLVGPLSIFGETGASYISEAELVLQGGAGRYAIRNGRIELRPALRPDGQPETYANVRLWVTQGTLGNTVDPGQLSSFLKKQITEVRVLNLNSAAGGTNQESFSSAQARFSAALLSRDRIVTRADLTNAVRSFDSRVLETEIEPGVARTEQGLKRLERIKVRMKADDLADPKAELPILKSELHAFLRERFPFDTELAVEVIAG